MVPDSGPPLPPDPPPPRMSIAHLMLLTLTTAICVSVMNFIAQQWDTFRSPGPPDPLMDVLRVGGRLWHCGILGTELALAGIVLTWIVQQRPQNVAPGHWLVLGLGLDALLSVIANCLSVLLMTGDLPIEIPYNRLSIFGIGEFVMATTWFALAERTPPGAWRVVPVLQGALSSISAIGWLLMAVGRDNFSSPGGFLSAFVLVAIGGLGVFVPGLVGIVLAIHDRVEQHPRDWLHVLGVTLIALQIVAAVFYRLIPPI